MESSRFDHWTRATARGGSRRSLVRAVAAQAAAAIVKSSDVAAGARCYGHGCPCINDRRCTDGLLCCGGMCMSAGDCGVSCRGEGDACPPECGFGEACASCCGGFCAGYGGCTSLYYAQEGTACGIADPTACSTGLSCCPTPGGYASDGICAYSCFYS